MDEQLKALYLLLMGRSDFGKCIERRLRELITWPTKLNIHLEDERKILDFLRAFMRRG
jgi:hypothetical protein